MIIDMFLEPRSAPQRRQFTLENPPDWLWDRWSAEESWAGNRVSEQTALNYSAYYACVRVLAETLASVPLKIYERIDAEGRRPARDHRIWPILHDRPNPELSSFQFRELMMGHLVTWGNAYAEKELDGAGRILALWPIPPDAVSVRRLNGVKWLEINKDQIQGRLRPDQYLHIPGLGYDGLQGYSPVRLHTQSLGLGRGAEEYAARWFASGGKPPFVIKHPGQMSTEGAARLRHKISEIHGGLSKSQRIMLLDEGMDVSTIGIPNDDAQVLETRKFQVEEMARVHRIPPHKIQHLERATFSNIEHQAIEFVQDVAVPWAVRWEQILTWEMFSPSERSRYFAEFNLDGLLRGDAKSRAEALSIQRQWGIINADEWRAKENMNPIEDGSGQTYIVPMNYLPADQSGVEMEPPAAERSGRVLAPKPRLHERLYDAADLIAQTDPTFGEVTMTAFRQAAAHRSARSRYRLAKSYMRVFERAATHWVNREVRAALRILKRAFETDEPIEVLLRELATFYEAFPVAIRRELLPVVLAFAELIRAEVIDEVGSDPNQALAVEKMANDYVDTFILRHMSSSEGQIRQIIRETELEAVEVALQQRFEEWGAKRAAKIGMNETIRAAGALSKAAYAMVGVTVLRWITVGKNCPLCNEMNGRVIGFDSFFLNAGDEIDPGVEGVDRLIAKRPISHPPLHRGCDCMISAG